MTATASKNDRECIKNSLGLKACAEVVGNPDCGNIMYSKHFKAGPDVDCLVTILTPVAQGLLEELIKYPLTIIYVPLKWCGFAYKIFESILGSRQYYPQGSLPTPENRLFAQFHSLQTKEMKDEILRQLCSSESTVRVVFATVALGMGVDIVIFGRLFMSPHHAPSSHTSKELAELGEMENQQLPFSIITIGTLQRTKLGCKKQFEHIAKVKAGVSETFCLPH